MQVNLDLRMRQVELEATEVKRKGVREYARTIWSTITKFVSKYVVYDEDAFLNDPKWPHLWS